MLFYGPTCKLLLLPRSVEEKREMEKERERERVKVVGLVKEVERGMTVETEVEVAALVVDCVKEKVVMVMVVEEVVMVVVERAVVEGAGCHNRPASR